jgi:hypothetical protein
VLRNRQSLPATPLGKTLRVRRNSNREKYRVCRRPVARSPLASSICLLGRFPAVSVNGKSTSMKIVFAVLVALGLMGPLATAAFAGPDDCGDGQMWDDDSQACVDNPD